MSTALKNVITVFALIVTAVLIIIGVWTGDDRWIVTGVVVSAFPVLYLFVGALDRII